ncbi:hypothetical protein B0A52_01745 [Exophiala mesophila]|uniref:Transcription factor domain-containing protein n=1 Tax=Exophiala mesophila TaxID=212818 RepID=A0A438NFV9_EXOME|nr:hypothetical protein B0A52_01745 [Exophiala mesophila]
MFVPYNGESKRFDTSVTFSAQRRFTSQKIHRAKREKAIRLKGLADSQNIPSPDPSRSDTTEDPPVSPPEKHSQILTPESEADSTVDANAVITRQDVQTMDDVTFDSSATVDYLKNATRLICESQRDNSSPNLRLPLNDMLFGGMRADPFANYPISPQTYFPFIVDFCREVVALGPIYFQFILSHEVLFEAIVTYVLCVQPRQTPETKVAMMHHYGSTLKNIRLSISDPSRRIGDDIILAIANLAVICAYCRDTKRFDTHLRGIRKLVEMRGGVDGLEKEDNWVKSGLTALEALAGVPPDSDSSSEPIPKISPTGDPSKYARTPVYPRHPFPPDMCAVIARMPEGFRELALTGQLSIQLMNRLNITRSQIVHLMATAPSKESDYEWAALMRASTLIERMAWLTVLVFHLRSSTYISDCKDLAQIAMECAKQGTRSQAQLQWVLWGSCLVVATPDCERLLAKPREQVANMLLDLFEQYTVDEMIENANRFLWTDGLSASLRTHMDYFRKNPFFS